MAFRYDRTAPVARCSRCGAALRAGEIAAVLSREVVDAESGGFRRLVERFCGRCPTGSGGAAGGQEA